MTPFEFAQRHLYPFKVRGNEIIPSYCPYCHGGRNRDKETFALNTNKLTFNCKRGSCAVSGTFRQLLRDFEDTGVRNMETFQRPARQYKTPAVRPQPASSKVEQYLKKRGFSPETWQRRGVGEHKGNIVFPYYESGELVMVKFRPPRKVKKGRKAWREPGGKPVFWGMDDCDPAKPLVIVEGEMDALALDEAGIPNVVSVPNGTSDLQCIDLCWDWLQQFTQIIIWVDNDEPGKKLQRNLINKLGAWRCSMVNSPRKDANEVLYHDGPEEVRRQYENARPVPVEGLIDLAEVEDFDLSQETRVRSGIRGLDKVLGGFFMGNVSIWTGINSSGKSTLLGQILLDSIDQGYRVCAYSGELPKRVFRYWIELQAAGPKHIETRWDAYKEADVPYPVPEARQKIREWYRGKFFLYDSFGGAKDKDIFKVFEYAAMRYNCKVFLIDNLSTTVFGEGDDYYRRQAEFVNRVADFAHQHYVHVHIVAHPRKTEGRLTKMDVKGSGGITDRADNVLSVHRCNDTEKQEYAAPNIIDVFKNRLWGEQFCVVPLQFHPLCKRFYHLDEGLKQYSYDVPSVEDVEKLFAEEGG